MYAGWGRLPQWWEREWYWGRGCLAGVGHRTELHGGVGEAPVTMRTPGRACVPGSMCGVGWGRLDL